MNNIRIAKVLIKLAKQIISANSLQMQRMENELEKVIKNEMPQQTKIKILKNIIRSGYGYLINKMITAIQQKEIVFANDRIAYNFFKFLAQNNLLYLVPCEVLNNNNITKKQLQILDSKNKKFIWNQEMNKVWYV